MERSVSLQRHRQSHPQGWIGGPLGEAGQPVDRLLGCSMQVAVLTRQAVHQATIEPWREYGRHLVGPAVVITGFTYQANRKMHTVQAGTLWMDASNEQLREREELVEDVIVKEATPDLHSCLLMRWDDD